MRQGAVVLGLAGALACAEGFAPSARVGLAIVPVFSEAAVGVLSGDLDRLHIRVTRVPSNAVVIDTSVAVDTAGNVDLPLTVPLLADPEQFAILLEGVRSADNTVLYGGSATVRVSASSTTPPPIEVPVSYVGPCQATSGCGVTAGPQGAALTQGDSLLMTASVDSAGIPVVGVPVSLINLDTTLIRVRSSRFVIARTGTPGGPARVVVQIRGDADTLLLTVLGPGGPVPTGVIVTPGYATVRLTPPNNTVQLADTVKDAAGNVLSPSLATWTSRNTSVATVSGAGLVTAVGRGLATIVAVAGTARDSTVVVVGDPSGAGDVAVFAAKNGRVFGGGATVGSKIAVDVVLDQVAAGSPVGSYKTRYRWNAGVLRYDSTTAGDFPAPVVNADTAATGVVVFASIDANGAGGKRTLARLWFTVTGLGSDGRALDVQEMSGVSPTFTNYWQLNRFFVVVAPGVFGP